MRFLRDPLPIKDFSTVWRDIGKVIDPLHLRNHRNASCKIDYNPQKCKDMYPDANFMVAEQTFRNRSSITLV